MAGNTTLFTTVFICLDASPQVPSIAPATSPEPAANVAPLNNKVNIINTLTTNIPFLYLDRVHIIV